MSFPLFTGDTDTLNSTDSFTFTVTRFVAARGGGGRGRLSDRGTISATCALSWLVRQQGTCKGSGRFVVISLHSLLTGPCCETCNRSGGSIGPALRHSRLGGDSRTTRSGSGLHFGRSQLLHANRRPLEIPSVF